MTAPHIRKENAAVTDIDVYTEKQRLVALVASAVLNRLDETGITHADLARRIGWQEGRVYQVLCGSHPMTLKDMALLALGCGFTWDVQPYEDPAAIKAANGEEASS